MSTAKPLINVGDRYLFVVTICVCVCVFAWGEMI